MTSYLVRAIGVALACTCVVAQGPGLRIFQPVGPHTTQLIDNQGNIVHSWPGTGNLSAHIEADGTLVRNLATGSLSIGGATGRIQRLDFNGNIIWDHLVDGPFQYTHHDIEPMPNGNILIIAWDSYTVADAINQGRDPALVGGTDWLPDAILELQQTGPTTGAVVWEWHIMDHLVQDYDPGKPNYGVVANHPELMDLNFPAVLVDDGDWNHFNGLDYDPVNDLIMFSARPQSEIYIIDHSTTTAEAAGHTGGTHGKGGDFLWRWGNPEAYDAGTIANQTLVHQHDPRFIPPGYPGAGNVTVFNNEFTATESAVHELVLPKDGQGFFVLDPSGRYGPVTPTWTFTAAGFQSLFVSSAERMPNGNTLVCSGLQNGLLEVDPAGQVVWNYTYPNSNLIFQSHYVDRSLWANATELPVGGGQVDFDHLLGSGHLGDFYLLLGSVSGTSPGTTIGGVPIPLNVDYLTTAMAELFNQGTFVKTIGTLDSNGGEVSSIVAAPGFIPPILAGTEMHFAHLIFDNTLTILRSGNATKVTIVP